MAKHFSIWIVTPPGYTHSRCFEEVALSLRGAFAELGFDAPIVTDPSRIMDWAIVLGANLLPTLNIKLPPRIILYNLEQVQDDSPWMKSGYIELLRRYPVWDYSSRNIEKFKALGINAALCGIGYMPCLEKIKQVPIQDIDVLFVGSLNDRRKEVLGNIAQRKKVTAGFNLYGAERDAQIARAKLVLNLHYFDVQIFEIVRVSYLLSNRVCVVSETGKDDELETPLKDGIAFAPYNGLVDMCFRLLDNADERARIANKGFECFSAMSQTPMLKRALASLSD